MLKAEKEGRKDPSTGQKTKNLATVRVQEDSDSDSVGLIAGHALSVSSSSETSSTWIIDSGPTCNVPRQHTIHHSSSVRRSDRRRFGRWAGTGSCRERRSGARHGLAKW